MSDEEFMKGMAMMGRNVRWSLRQMAREVGLDHVPAGNPIYVRGGGEITRHDLPRIDHLDQLEEGEAEYIANWKASKAGGTKEGT